MKVKIKFINKLLHAISAPNRKQYSSPMITAGGHAYKNHFVHNHRSKTFLKNKRKGL